VLESVTYSEPKLFATGKYKDTDADEGENPAIPEPPSDPDSPGGSGKDSGPSVTDFG